MTESYLLLGGDVSKSPTPGMMNAAFRALKVEATYDACSVKTEGLGSAFARISEARMSGFNVTIPHKGAIVPFLSSLDGISSKIGAVNTVRREGRSYHGYNTDVDGILEPLQSSKLPKSRRAFVIGTGGAARAFCAAMRKLDCCELVALSRYPRRATDFLESMKSAFPEIDLKIAPADNPPSEAPDLIFNASPAGADGIALPKRTREILEARPIVFEAVYLPVRTELITMAEELGCKTIYGHEMLLAQGAKAVKIWTGFDPPVQAMKEALFNSLGVQTE